MQLWHYCPLNTRFVVPTDSIKIMVRTATVESTISHSSNETTPEMAIPSSSLSRTFKKAEAPARDENSNSNSQQVQRQFVSFWNALTVRYDETPHEKAIQRACLYVHFKKAEVSTSDNSTTTSSLRYQLSLYHYFLLFLTGFQNRHYSLLESGTGDGMQWEYRYQTATPAILQQRTYIPSSK